MESKFLGFVGVGQIGGPMALRLLDQGYELVVYDARADALEPFRARGATIGASPADVASQAEVVLVSLPTPAVVKEVALGERGLRHGTKMRVYIDLSTTGRIVSREVAAALAQRDVTTLDAPVSGGVPGAVRGTLAVMVGGDTRTYEELREVLSSIGKPFQVGEQPGDGQMMKLVNNVLSAAAMAATSEAVCVGVKAGLDPGKIIEVLNASSGRNSATVEKFPRSILTGTFDYGFKTALMIKDVNLFLEEAEKLGTPTWVTSSVAEIWSFIRSHSDPDSDFTAIVRQYEEWAGVECRSRELAGGRL